MDTFDIFSRIRFGDSLDQADQDISHESCRLFGPFSRKILMHTEIVDIELMIGFRFFSNPHSLGLYLYKWDNNLNDEENHLEIHSLKPNTIFLFSEAFHLALQIHNMTNDNDYNYPQFRSIFHETPIHELLHDKHLLLNFSLIEWEFRIEIIKIGRYIQGKTDLSQTPIA